MGKEIVINILLFIGLPITGCILGVALAFGISFGIGTLSKYLSPNDPTAFSVAIIIIVLAPAGFIGGIVGGIYLALSLM